MTDTTLSVSVTNVGGIDETTCSFSGPVGIISGPNASNKTSLLRAIAFGLGHPSVPIRSGADEARVELTVGDETVTRTATRTGHGVSVNGDGLVDPGDRDVLERFACLLEFNELRDAVRHEGDYATLLKEPMALEALERERSQKLSTKNELKRDLERLGDVDARLEERREQLSETRDRVASLEADLDDLRARQSEVVDGDEAVDELRENRASLVSERDQYRRQITDLEDAVAELDDRIEETEASLADAREEAEQHDVEALREERTRIERDLADLDDRLDVLQSILTANREMQASDYTGALGQESSLMGDSVTCWTCGQDAAVEDIEATTDDLADVVERDKQRREEYEPRLDEIDAEIAAAEDAQRRVEEFESQIRDLERRRGERVDSLETKHDELERVTEEIEALDDELAEHESEQQSEANDVASEIEQTRVDLHSARSEVERLESSIEDLEANLEERDRKQSRVAELSDEIAEITERVENLEDDLRASFNDAMDELVDVLDYDRLERVWLDGDFDIVVAREVDGAVREDELTHLSESERESVGLMLALAGYLAYDVADDIPVLLMDTLGAFDADRTKDLLAYFREEVPLVLTALLPESADALSEHGLAHDRLEAPERAAD